MTETPARDSAAVPQADPAAVPIPEEIDSSTGKLVYFYLGVAGGATVRELEAGLGLSGFTVSAVLDALHEKAVVEQRDDRYVPAN